MEILLLLAMNGLIWGLIIALIALGLSIIFGLLDIINIAHGDFFMVGTMIAWVTVQQTGALATTVTASCPGAKRVLGGGGEFVPIVGTVLLWEVRVSKPMTTAPQGWQYSVLADVNDDYGVRAWAICADVP